VNLEAKGRHHNGKHYSVREVAEVSGVSEIVRLLDVSKIDEIRAGLIETGGERVPPLPPFSFLTLTDDLGISTPSHPRGF